MLPNFVENPNPEIYRSNNYVVLDFETTNIDKGNPCVEDNGLVLSCWNVVKDGIRTRKSVRGSEFEVEELVNDIDDSDFLVAHNAKFELGWLERCGYDIGSRPVYCSQIAEYVIAGNRKWGQMASLNECLKRRGMGQKEDSVSMLIKAGVCPSEIHEDWLLEYCIADVDLCEQLFLDQRKFLYKYGLAPVFYSRCLLTPVLTDIERNGMVVDGSRVRSILDRSLEDLHVLEGEMIKLTGGINMNSPKQFAEFLFLKLKFRIPRDHRKQEMLTKTCNDIFPEGQPATNADAIGQLRARTKKQERFLEIYTEYNNLSTVISKYLQKLMDCADENDGLLLGQFNQTKTMTHRLSSSGKVYKIQFQNMARWLKPVFTCRHEGWLIQEADQGQLEYRIAVDRARDTQGLADITNGVDSHSFTAEYLYDGYKAMEGSEKKHYRTLAKAHTFKPLYGGKSGTPEQVAYYEAFREKHTQIVEMQDRDKDIVLRDKQLRIESGLVLYWPHCRITNTGYITESTSICNYPVQNLATAEVVPLSLVCMWYRMRDAQLQSFIVNTVHDSVISEVHPEEREEVEVITKQAMEVDVVELVRKLYDYNIETPLDAESEFWSHWTTNEGWEKEHLANKEAA